jgi:hypothetical protein
MKFVYDIAAKRSVDEFVEREDWEEPEFLVGRGVYIVNSPNEPEKRMGLHVDQHADGTWYSGKFPIKGLTRFLCDLTGLSADMVGVRSKPRTMIVATSTRILLDISDSAVECPKCKLQTFVTCLPDNVCTTCFAGA